MPSLTILGVDPGLTRCGLGIVTGPVARPVLVHHCCVTTAADEPLERRLLAVHDAIARVIAEHAPDVVAVERVLFSANARTAMATGQAAGVALVAAARSGLPVASYSPNEVKQTVTGSGGADKDAVGRLVAAQLRLAAVPKPADVADALAVALTHLARSRTGVAVARSAAGDGRTRLRNEVARGGAQDWESLIAARGLRSSGGTAAGSGPDPAARRSASLTPRRPGGGR